MGSKTPSAGSIRQKLRAILQEQILSSVRSEKSVRLLSAQLPLRAAAGIAIRELPIAVLDESAACDNYPTGLRWDELGMHAIQFPVLCCVFDGEIDLRIGVTTRMLNGITRPKQQCGGYIVSLPAPSFFAIPSGVPYPTGTFFPWERPNPEQATAHILWLRVLPTGALCHTTLIYNGVQEAQYSLLLDDPLLWPMMEILLAVLHPTTGNLEIAQAQLLVLCLRLQHDLQTTLPLMTDGLSSRFPAGRPPAANLPTAPEAASPILNKASEFVQLHLHEAITPADIAAHVRLKPARLNRIFQQELQTSIMRYVLQQRMEAARLLLQTSELSVQEISRLVGFRYLPHFTRSFTEFEGVPPLKDRQKQASHYHSSNSQHLT
jgi:AraC-like DNA-binding protein